MRTTFLMAGLLAAASAQAGSNPFLAQGNTYPAATELSAPPSTIAPLPALAPPMPPANPPALPPPAATHGEKATAERQDNPAAWIVVGGVNGERALLRLYRNSYGMGMAGAYASSAYASSAYATPYATGASSMSQMGYGSTTGQPQTLLIRHGKYFWANGKRYRAWIEGNNVKFLVGRQVVFEAEPDTPVPLGWTQAHGAPGVSTQAGGPGLAAGLPGAVTPTQPMGVR